MQSLDIFTLDGRQNSQVVMIFQVVHIPRHNLTTVGAKYFNKPMYKKQTDKRDTFDLDIV